MSSSGGYRSSGGFGGAGNFASQPSGSRGSSSAQLNPPGSRPEPRCTTSRMRMQDLLQELGHPNGSLDEDTEEFLLQLADDFIDAATSGACMLAKHRNASIVEAKDVHLYLERQWNMCVGGACNAGEAQQRRKPIKTSDTHKRVMRNIARASKKAKNTE